MFSIKNSSSVPKVYPCSFQSFINVSRISEFVLDVDSVIMSIGTSPNPLIRSTTKGLETNKHGCIVTQNDDGLTSREGVYAGGDAVTGAATVILAMGAGKAAAKAIDEYVSSK